MKKLVQLFITTFALFLFAVAAQPLALTQFSVSAASSPTSDTFANLQLNTTNPYYSTLATDGAQTNQLRLSFQTTKTIPNGQFVIAIPTNNTSRQSKQLPSADGLICPTPISGQFEFLTPLATHSASLNSFDLYSCPYSGAGLAGTDFTNNLLLLNQLPNPTATSSTQPQVNQHHVYFTQLPITANLNQLDPHETFDQLTYGLIEQTKLDQLIAQNSAAHATAPDSASTHQLSFEISGLAARSQACGRTTLISTEPNQVNFEDLESVSFSNAAQRVVFKTNAPFGYLVTAVASDQPSLDGAGCAGADAIGNPACIPDITANSITPQKSAAWTDPQAQSGFGFTLENLADSTAAVFTFATQIPTPTTNLFRQFTDRSASELPVPIFRHLSATTQLDPNSSQPTPTSTSLGDEAHICYQVSPTAENSLGIYKNQIIYTVTASF